MKAGNNLIKIGAFICLLIGFQARAQNKIMVCGDSKLLMVNYDKSKDSTPHIIWTWDAHKATDLPEEFSKRKFNSLDDCKASADGKSILIASSSGAIAKMDTKTQKIQFYATVPNAHSIEYLPNGYIAAAASTHPLGNKLMIFNPENNLVPVWTDSLYSAHGVVWHAKTKILYALGYDVLRAYTVEFKSNEIALQKVNEWRIPGKSGHDLTMTPDQKSLYITEHTNAWRFDIGTSKFEKISDFPVKKNIKSISRNKKNQIIYTEPEESWWTFSVKFLHPEKKLLFPDIKVYKARWFKL